jgi:hypothetical protein
MMRVKQIVANLVFHHEEDGGDGRYHVTTGTDACACGAPHVAFGSISIPVNAPQLGFQPPEHFCVAAKNELTCVQNDGTLPGDPYPDCDGCQRFEYEKRELIAELADLEIRATSLRGALLEACVWLEAAAADYPPEQPAPGRKQIAEWRKLAGLEGPS